MTKSSVATLAACLLGGAGLFLVARLPAGPWIIDDAAITYAYAESVARGHGFRLAAEAMPVEGFSNPLLFFFSLAAALLSLLDPFIFHVVLEPLEFGLLVWLTHRLLQRCAPQGSAWRALAFTAVFAAIELLTPSTLIWYGSGLENLQVTLGIAALAVRLETAGRSGFRPLADGLLVAAVTLVRPEAVLYPMLMGAGWLAVSVWPMSRDERRRMARALLGVAAVAGVVLGLLLLARWLHFGAPLPNTFYAKVEGAGLSANARYVGKQVVNYAGVLILVVVALGIPVTTAAARVRGALAGAVLAGLALPLIGGSDWMGEHRFATGYFAAAHLMFVVALAGARPIARLGRVVPAVTVLAGIGAVAGLATQRPRAVEFLRRRHATVDNVIDGAGFPRLEVQRRLGLVAPAAGLPDIGATLLVGQMHLVDTLLLADFHGARIKHDQTLVSRYQLFERQLDLWKWQGASSMPREAFHRELVCVAIVLNPAAPGWQHVYWTRRDVIEPRTLDPAAVPIGQRGPVHFWSSPRTVWQATPGAIVRVEILFRADPSARAAEFPAGRRLRATLGEDVEELALLSATSRGRPDVQPVPGVLYRQGLVLHAPRQPGRYDVQLTAGEGEAPMTVGTVEVLPATAFDEPRVRTIVGQGPVLEQAFRLAQLREQQAARPTRAEIARDIAEFRAAADARRWDLLRPWRRLSRHVLSPPPASPAIARIEQELRERAAAEVSAHWKARRDPADALLAAGRLAESWRRLGMPGLSDHPTIVDVRREGSRQLPVEPVGRYKTLVGLTFLDPRDVDAQKALLAARPQGVDLPLP